MHLIPYPPAVRAWAAGLTLLVHGVFALLWLLEESMPDRPLPAARRLVGIWIHLPAREGLQVVEELKAATLTPVSPAQDEPQDRAAPVRSSAITLVTEVSPSSSPTAPLTSGDPTNLPVDWISQAGRLASRAAEAAENEPSFSPPADKAREPCKPRESSFEWKDKPPPPEPQVNPLMPPTDSVKMGGARVGVVGIGIRLFGPKEEPNKHLFDDMKAGKTPYSSVPDPNYCD